MTTASQTEQGYKTPMNVAWEFDYEVDIGPLQNLYEKAKELQWNVTTDIPWHDLDRYELPPDQEFAFCQLCTLLSEVEMIATDLPAKWSHHMNSYFQEVKGFIATQCMDEARHSEAFRKRALYGEFSRVAYAATRDFYREHFPRLEDPVPAMLVTPQSFGDLLVPHAHLHALVSLGVFDREGEFHACPEDLEFSD